MTSHSPADGGALPAEEPKGPWTGSDAGQGSGPRNPWAVPPKGNRQTALDDFLKRARAARGGGGPGLTPPPTPRALWGVGAGAAIAAWLVLTSVHPIGPGQRGVVTWFGRYAGTLDPGVHLTPPAPIAAVAKVDMDAVNTADLPTDGGARPMLTRDGSLADVAYSIRWSVADPAAYLFDLKEPGKAVAAAAESAMREAIAAEPLDQALSPQRRDAIAARARARTQALLDTYRAGVRVVDVTIRQADTPDGVADASKDVAAAQAEAQTQRNKAEQYRQQRLVAAERETADFDAFYAQYKLAPEVTRRRLYYQTMEKVLGNNDKTIVEPTNVAPLLQLDHGRRLPDQPPMVAPATGGGQ